MKKRKKAKKQNRVDAEISATLNQTILDFLSDSPVGRMHPDERFEYIFNDFEVLRHFAMFLIGNSIEFVRQPRASGDLEFVGSIGTRSHLYLH